MMKMIKETSFENKLKQAIATPGLRYQELNLKQNPFVPLPALDALEELLVDRDDARDQLILGLEDMMQGVLPSVTIIGGKGIGKTHLLISFFKIFQEVTRNDPSIASHLIRTSSDLAIFKNQLIAFSGSEPRKKIVLFIDEAEKKWRDHYEDIEALIEAGIKIIWAWNAQSWSNAKGTEIIPPKTRTILLGKLSEKDCIDIINKRLNYHKLHKDKPHVFDYNATRNLAIFSYGVPYTLINLADRCLQYAMKYSKNKIDASLVMDFLKENKIPTDNTIHEHAKKKIERISQAELRVLGTIYVMTTSYDRGITITEISNELGLSVPTVYVHAKKLYNDGILERKKTGKEVFYSMKGEYFLAIEKKLDESH